MPFKINFSMTWLGWLSLCIIFQIKKRNNKLTDYQTCCLLFVFFFLTNSKIMLSSSRRQDILEDLQALRPRLENVSSRPRMSSRLHLCSLRYDGMRRL